MKDEQPSRKTFSKEEIFSTLDGILESGPLNLCGITIAMPVVFNIPREMAWAVFAEWAETVMRRYRKVVDSDGKVAFRLRDSGNGGRKESAPGTGAAAPGG